jgi:pilus assembly protein CpaB
MNWKTWLPLLLAVALGLLAMKVARDVISKHQAAPAAVGGTAIVVVKSDLPAGAALRAEDLGTAKIGGDFSSSAVFTSPADVQGRVLVTPAARNSPVLESMLAPKGSGTGLQALIPQGMRAITIEVNEFSGVAGNLVPGCKVDVVASFNGEAGGEMVSRTIVQNVKVSAVGMRRAADGEQNANGAGQVKSVTLLTTPKEAEEIELATATGRPRLVLRSGNDSGSAHSEAVTVAELRYGGERPRRDPFQQVELIRPSAPSPSPAAAPTTQPLTRTRQVKVIRAGVESEATIEEPVPPTESEPSSKWLTGASTDELPLNKN